MSGGIAGRGKPGPQGPQGIQGPKGDKGDPAFTLAIGDVTAVPYGGTPAVVNTGTDQDQIWDIAVPTGATGVLTGLAPPTGSDGTSLGQLYYCTANQQYYGLVELNENANVWRPIMTQDSAIRRYEMDVVEWDAGNESDLKNGMVTGHFSFMFDDVKQQLTVAGFTRGNVPIGGNVKPTYLLVDADNFMDITADAEQRGITSIPVPGSVLVNNVSIDSTPLNLHGYNWRHGSVTGWVDASERSLLQTIAGTVPSGTQPAVVPHWVDGKLDVITNMTGAPASTEYGQAPVLPNNGDKLDSLALTIVYGDADYAAYFRWGGNVVIPYA